MSKTSYELKADVRERVGKGSSRELRRNGLIPAVIYGNKQAPLSIVINTNEITKRIHAGGFMTTVATINVDGKKIRVLPKDYQLDPVRDFTLHVDFLRVTAKSEVNVNVPVRFINEDQSEIKQDGVLNIVRHDIELTVQASNIPEAIIVDLAGRKIGDSIHISDITLPEGAELVIADRDFTIASIVPPVEEIVDEIVEDDATAEAEAEDKADDEGDAEDKDASDK